MIVLLPDLMRLDALELPYLFLDGEDWEFCNDGWIELDLDEYTTFCLVAPVSISLSFGIIYVLLEGDSCDNISNNYNKIIYTSLHNFAHVLPGFELEFRPAYDLGTFVTWLLFLLLFTLLFILSD